MIYGRYNLRNQQRVDCVNKGKQIVPSEQTALVRLRLGQSDHQCNTDNDNCDKTKQEWGLELEAVGEPGGSQDGDNLDGAEWHVEQHGLIRGEPSQVLQDDGAEDGGNGGTGIDSDDHDLKTLVEILHGDPALDTYSYTASILAHPKPPTRASS